MGVFSPQGAVLGLDVGDTSVCCACWTPAAAAVETLEDAQGEKQTPCCVHFTAQTHQVGDAALRRPRAGRAERLRHYVGLRSGDVDEAAAAARPEVVAELARLHSQSTAAGYADVCRMLAEADNTALLYSRRPACPCVVIAGEHDTVAPTTAQLAERVRCRRVVIPSTAHAAYLEAPDRYNDALRSFLAALRPAARM
eukprot:TRINITY_DN1611_c0_g1_i1.p1 TRINITY_DN1611_c0_g1~~TRINITY_DN1611_c0_g1_i1.p1  ORF type:complete len:197 (+),score=65.77 TRINITY_DN1611_c0_g1_i1:60-650(+)